ncbi:MAG: AlkA N-terminal domain-containing protein [Leucobacter sp.]
MVHTRLTRELRTPAPFDGRALRDFFSVHAIPGRDRIDADGHTEHAIDVPSGLAVATIDWQDIASDGANHEVLPVTFELPDPADAECATRVVRRMLDLDTDLVVINSALAVSPMLRPLIEARPGLRLPGARDAAEVALGTVLGQQVSLAAARTLQGRLARRFARSTSGVRGFRAAPDRCRPDCGDASDGAARTARAHECSRRNTVHTRPRA